MSVDTKNTIKPDPNGDGLHRPRAHWRVFLLIVAALAFVLAVGLPIAGYKVISKFRAILESQVVHDNDAIAQYFEGFLRESRKNFESEDEWLRYVGDFVDALAMPNRGYVCMIDSEENYIVYPGFQGPVPAGDLRLTPYNGERETFDGSGGASVAEMLRDSDTVRMSGRLTSPGGSQLVDFRRVMIEGEPWLIGIHQYDEVVNVRIKELMPYIVTLGSFLFLAIVLPFALFTAFLIRQYDRARGDYIARIEEHSRRIEHTAGQLRETNQRLNHLQESKARLYARLSHDLRAPLNSVISSCSMVAEEVYGPVNDKQRGAMERVERNVGVLLKLIDGILELSKLESGSARVTPEPFALEPLIRELAGNMQPLAENKGLDLRVAAPIPAPLLNTDREKLYLMLQNLTNNAIKFTEAGEVEIAAEAVNEREVAISVRDTGPGIEPGDQEAIFQEFIRGGNGHEAGVGLGLAITKELSNLLGGRIRLKSAPGEGSVFTVTLPREYRPL